ncbi:unnamed protein product, partial [Closterium sp. NIES-53]
KVRSVPTAHSYWSALLLSHVTTLPFALCPALPRVHCLCTTLRALCCTARYCPVCQCTLRSAAPSCLTSAPRTALHTHPALPFARTHALFYARTPSFPTRAPRAALRTCRALLFARTPSCPTRPPRAALRERLALPYARAPRCPALPRVCQPALPRTRSHRHSCPRDPHCRYCLGIAAAARAPLLLAHHRRYRPCAYAAALVQLLPWRRTCAPSKLPSAHHPLAGRLPLNRAACHGNRHCTSV